jgi:hypothetical protein
MRDVERQVMQEFLTGQLVQAIFDAIGWTITGVDVDDWT